MAITDEAIRALIHRSCLALDALDFDAYLALCAPRMRYRIITFSPEIRKDVILMNQDFAGLTALLESLPNHLQLPGKLMRHASVYVVEREGSGESASATTAVIVIQTDPHGSSAVFAAGRYEDRIDLTGDAPLLARRFVRLDTRDLGIGVEVPL